MRFMGVGAMIVAGLWSIFSIRKGIAQGLRQTLGSYKASMHAGHGGAVRERTDEDMEPKWILLLLGATLLIIAFLYLRVTHGDVAVSALASVLMLVCSFFFVAVAAYIVGLVGSSNSPVSGMTICSVLLTSAFIFLFGFRGELAILATMGVAGVVCCATCTSGDVCQDLKTGSLVKATPRRQQWVELIGVVTSSFVMWWSLETLRTGYGFDPNAAEPLEGAPGPAVREPDGGLLRRQGAAGGPDRDGHRHRRRDRPDRPARAPEAQEPFPAARDAGRRRHVPALRADVGDLPRRDPGLGRRPERAATRVRARAASSAA